MCCNSWRLKHCIFRVNFVASWQHQDVEELYNIYNNVNVLLETVISIVYEREWSHDQLQSCSPRMRSRWRCWCGTCWAARAGPRAGWRRRRGRCCCPRCWSPRTPACRSQARSWGCTAARTPTRSWTPAPPEHNRSSWLSFFLQKPAKRLEAAKVCSLQLVDSQFLAQLTAVHVVTHCGHSCARLR